MGKNSSKTTSKTSNKGTDVTDEIKKDETQQVSTNGETGTAGDSGDNSQGVDNAEQGKDTIALIGSDFVPSTFVVDNGDYTAGEFIVELVSTSGLTGEEWNALTQEERDTKAKDALVSIGIAPLETGASASEGTDVGETTTTDTVAPAAVEELTSGTVTEVTTTTAAEPQSLSNGIDIDEELRQNIDVLVANSDYAANVFLGMFTYMRNMRPGPAMSEEDGATHQANFFRTLVYMFEQADDAVFTKTFALFLQVFTAHQNRKQVFNDIYINRFADTIPLIKNDRIAYTRWVNLFLLTANPAGRQDALSQVDLNKTFQHGLSEVAVGRIKAFFNV